MQRSTESTDISNPGDLVSVIVVNWNGRHYLHDCLTALSVQTAAEYEVVLVDNASTDGSVEFVAEHFPSVRIVRNDRNRGFAAANNIGFQHARGNYLVTLNNDTCANPDWLAELVKGVHTGPDIGMCASTMVLRSDPSIVDSTGIAFNRCGVAWDRLSGCRLSDINPQPVEVFGPCAGAAMYRREMIDQVGGFDEDFFIYLEDVDLAWRAQSHGWRCLSIPAAVVQHVHSGTSREGSPGKNYNLGRNKVWMLYKNLSAAQLGWLPLILLYDFSAALYSLYLYRNWWSIRGRIAGLRGLKGMKLKRHNSLKDAQPPSRWVRLLEPLEPPWRLAGQFAQRRH